jgi:hypothetical protein
MKKIVTHPGTAHQDDFLACCVLAAKFGIPIERREPTQSDLDDVETLVLDVGGRFEPEKNNFDHHHDLSLPCAFTQIVAWKLRAEEKFHRVFKWFENVDFSDRHGAKALGNKYGLTEEQMAELGAPAFTALMAMFEKLSYLAALNTGHEHAHDEKLREYLYEIMRGIGQELITYAENYDVAWERLERCEQKNLNGYQIVINPCDDITATGDFMRERNIAVMCSWDNRGQGWAILRSNDYPQINLAQLANDPRIAFAHKGGFIAKTKEKIAVDELFELLKTVVK